MGVLDNYDLLRCNTLGVPCVAEYAMVVNANDELDAAAEWQRQSGTSWRVLGGGSNVVLPARLAGLTVLVRLRGFTASVDGRRVSVDVGAGEVWHDVVRRCLAMGWFGIENLALIPGRAGAAPIQNIGAYGAELSEVFDSCTVFDWRSGQRRQLSHSECRFGYRDSVFKHALRGEVVITALRLRLDTHYRPRALYRDVETELSRMGVAAARPVDVAEAVIRVRRRKLPDPRRHRNAGSFFKNPVIATAEAEMLLGRFPDLLQNSWPDPAGRKFAAAALIERCGLKGVRRGAVGTWPRQPLVLVNYGTGNAQQVDAFAAEVMQAVSAKFDVQLEVEPDRFDPAGSVLR